MSSCRYCLAISVSLSLVTGCGSSQRVEIQRLQAELVKTQAELAAARVVMESTRSAVPRYLEELERLDVLRTKSAITTEEFEAKKRELLGAASASKSETSAAPVSMTELAQQLRTLGTLYNTSAITQSEHQSKKTILLRQRVSPIDLKVDVETARTLYSQSIINQQEYEVLKRNLLELDAAK